MTETSLPEVHCGFKDPCFERSPTTFIDGRDGELWYRGYSPHDLAAHSSFEETAYLLFFGELPGRSQLDAFDVALKGARTLSGPIPDVIRAAEDAYPLDVLRTALSALAAHDPKTNDNSLDATRRNEIRLTPRVPTSRRAKAPRVVAFRESDRASLCLHALGQPRNDIHRRSPPVPEVKTRGKMRCDPGSSSMPHIVDADARHDIGLCHRIPAKRLAEFPVQDHLDDSGDTDGLRLAGFADRSGRRLHRGHRLPLQPASLSDPGMAEPGVRHRAPWKSRTIANGTAGHPSRAQGVISFLEMPMAPSPGKP